VLVFATRVNGEFTLAPFAGLDTVMADAVALHARMVNIVEKESFIKYLM
jgi:hypothetical protein